MQLITKRSYIVDTAIFSSENCFICNIEVKQSLLSKLIAFQFLAFLYEKLCNILGQILCLMFVASEKGCKLDYAMLFVL